jgi:amidase
MFYEPEVRRGSDKLSPIFREFLEIAERSGELTSVELLNVWAELDLLRSKTLEEMREFPLLLCPVASVPAWKHGERAWMVGGRRVEYLDSVRYTQWFNTLGAPAAVIPVGRSPEGLPIGVQIAARPFDDEMVLGVAGVLDRVFGYAPPKLAVSG